MFRLISNSRRTAALILSIVLILGITGCSAKGVEGNEWLLIQKTCLTDLEAFASGMDEVYSLYIIGSMSQSDFQVELNLLKKQYGILNAFYDDLKAQNPVKEGSHSYISKRGTDGLQNCYYVLGEILTHSVDTNGKPLEPKQMSYTYLAYKQQLASSLSEYVTAIVWLEESQSN